jgi:hypothetical protein
MIARLKRLADWVTTPVGSFIFATVFIDIFVRVKRQPKGRPRGEKVPKDRPSTKDRRCGTGCGPLETSKLKSDLRSQRGAGARPQPKDKDISMLAAIAERTNTRRSSRAS